jgi:hypothetical protein
MVCEMDIRIFPRYAIKFVQVVKVYYMLRVIPWIVVVLLECLASY